MSQEKPANFEESKQEILDLLNSVQTGKIEDIQAQLTKISTAHQVSIPEVADNFKVHHFSALYNIV
jgi:hypothetical protein